MIITPLEATPHLHFSVSYLQQYRYGRRANLGGGRDTSATWSCKFYVEMDVCKIYAFYVIGLWNAKHLLTAVDIHSAFCLMVQLMDREPRLLSHSSN